MSWTQGLVPLARKNARNARSFSTALSSVGGRRVHPKYQRRIRRVRPLRRRR